MTSKSYLILLSCFILKQALVAQVVPPPATQAEVDAGANRFKYVTPYTLANSGLISGPTNGVTATTATNIVNGIISLENLGTLTNADMKSFTVSDKILLSKRIHPSSEGYEFWDDFNRTITNSPGVSPSGHTWGFSSASGVNSNVVFVQDGAFKIATNAQAGATYWGITNSNPNTVWNKFKGSFLYREYDANGFRQNLGFILANNYFRGGTNWLHVGINQNGFYAQRELADFFINELFATELETDVEHTYEILLSDDKLWARVAGNYYFVQDDAITNYTSFPVVIYEHNMKMTNRPAQYFGEWLSAAAGQFESPIVNMAKPFSFSSNSVALTSVAFSDSSSQTTAASNSVVVAAGTGGITVTPSGSGGVMTYTISDDDAGGGGGGGGAGTFPLNTTQFDTNANASVKNGAPFTNITIRGFTLPTLTASRPLVLNSSGNPTNATGTPDGTKFLRDDGVLAVPSGGTGSTNPVAFTSGSVGVSNYFGLGFTNTGSNAVQVIDCMGPQLVRSFINGNTTLVLTNMPAWTNAQYGGKLRLQVRHGSGTVTLASLHPIDFGRSFFIAQGNTNLVTIEFNGQEVLGTLSHEPAEINTSYSSVVEIDQSVGQAVVWNITNRVTGNLSLILTNPVSSRQATINVIGEASGGTDRTVTLVPHTGSFVVNKGNTTARTNSYVFTLQDGYAANIELDTVKLTGTNLWLVTVNEYAYGEAVASSSSSGGLSFLGDWWVNNVVSNIVGGTFTTNKMSIGGGGGVASGAADQQARALPYGGTIRGVMLNISGTISAGSVGVEVFTNGVATGVNCVLNAAGALHTNATANVSFPANTAVDLRYFSATNLTPTGSLEMSGQMILQVTP